MKIAFFTCSESAAIDARSNRASIFNIAEEINAQTFPTLIPQICVLGMAIKGPDDPSRMVLTLRMVQNGKAMVNSPIEVDFRLHARSRILTHIGGIVCEAPGRLDFILAQGDRELAVWSIPVSQTGASEPAISPGQKAVAAVEPPDTAPAPPVADAKSKPKKKGRNG